MAKEILKEQQLRRRPETIARLHKKTLRELLAELSRIKNIARALNEQAVTVREYACEVGNTPGLAKAIVDGTDSTIELIDVVFEILDKAEDKTDNALVGKEVKYERVVY